MDKVKALIEGVTQDIVACLVEDESVTVEQALDAVYNSIVFAKLSDKETGLYKESYSYVATLLRDELASGSLIQAEI